MYPANFAMFSTTTLTQLIHEWSTVIESTTVIGRLLKYSLDADDPLYSFPCACFIKSCSRS